MPEGSMTPELTNKLKILWKNRNTWVNSLEWWWCCITSHEDWEKEYKIYWFWMSLNNWYHMFDEPQKKDQTNG